MEGVGKVKVDNVPLWERRRGAGVTEIKVIRQQLADDRGGGGRMEE